MPPPLDITGQRWGKLVALSRAPDLLSASGKSRRVAWLCRCDCGREEIFPAKRLPYCPSNAARKDVATCCSKCRSQRICTVCSKPFESERYRATCSDACALINRRAIDMACYYRKIEIDPTYNQKIRSARNARAAVDPEYKERLRSQQAAQDARKRERIRSNPELAQKERDAYRARYAENAANIHARRRIRLQQRLEEMTQQELEEYQQNLRDYNAAQARKRRDTPEGAAANREAQRQIQAKKRLASLHAVAAEITKRSNKQ